MAVQRPSRLGETTLTVDRSAPGAFRSLGEAFRAVESGAMIRVRPGTYVESDLVIDRPIEIVGDGPRERVVVILTTPLRLSGAGVALRALTLIGRNSPPAEPSPETCAVFAGGGEVTIADCEIRSETGSCVGVADAARTLRDCRRSDAADSGLIAAAGAEIIIEDCEVVQSAKIGVLVAAGARATLRNCRIDGGRGNGLVIRESHRATAEGCAIAGNALANVV